MTEIKSAYAGEAMLLRWGENHKGRTVTLLLDPDKGSIHPFKNLRCGDNGQRMQIVAVLTDENEQPMNPPPQVGTSASETPLTKPRSKWPTPYTRANIAGMKIKEPEFQQWIGAKNEAEANMLLKAALKISSKKELDSDPTAGERWDKLLASFDYRDRL